MERRGVDSSMCWPEKSYYNYLCVDRDESISKNNSLERTAWSKRTRNRTNCNLHTVATDLRGAKLVAHLEEWRWAPEPKQRTSWNVEVPHNRNNGGLSSPVGGHFPVGIMVKRHGGG